MSTGLRAVAALHGGVVGLRNKLFDSGRMRTEKLPRPVVSVGNVAVGGTGKTPFVEELARLLSDEGFVICILSRGYGRTREGGPFLVSSLHEILCGPSEAGDEPYLLARRLPGVPVVVGADRVAAGKLALEKLPVHVFLLDDGFQHRKLHRDVDLVLIDAADPWAGGGLLPAGRLREPLDSLKRATAIGLTRVDRCQPAALAEAKAELSKIAPTVPVFTTRSRPTGLRRIPRGLESLERLRDLPVHAIAGIARPESFFADAEALGARLVGRRAFDDHHAYTREDVAEICESAVAAGAAAVLTTEKDAVRLPWPKHAPIPAYTLRQRTFVDAPEALVRFVGSRVVAQPGARG